MPFVIPGGTAAPSSPSFSSQNGLIGPSDLITTLDAIGGYIKYLVAPLGQGLAVEAAIHSLSYQALLAQTKILGDGVTNYGIANLTLQSKISTLLANLFINSRYEAYANNQLRTIISELNQELSTSTNLLKYLVGTQTSQWIMQGSGVQALDTHLQRMNATNVGVPVTPTNVPTMTASTGGSLPNVAAGSAPTMCYTFVGANDWLESQPSPSSTQVALTGANNAYTIGNLPTVPAGVTKIRLYRTLFAGTALVWVKDVPVSAGAAPTTLKFINPDIALFQSVSPPVWAQALVLPESALAYAVTNMASNGNPLGAFLLSTSGLLSPSNVVLNSVNGILGYSNPASSGTFAGWNAGTTTIGSIQNINDTTQGLQGFLGAFSIQARTTSALDVNASISNVGYTYITAASPLTPLTSTLSGPFTLPLALASTISLSLPAGQCIRSVTSMTVSSSTAGSLLLEAIPLRSI